MRKQLKITSSHAFLLLGFAFFMSGEGGCFDEEPAVIPGDDGGSEIGMCQFFGFTLSLDSNGVSSESANRNPCTSSEGWPVDAQLTFSDLPTFVSYRFNDARYLVFQADPGSPMLDDHIVSYLADFGALGQFQGTFRVSVHLPDDRVTVAVSKSAGAGEITSAPAGISCGATCEASFKINETVQLSVTPGPGWQFDSWLGATCADAAVTDNGTAKVISVLVPASGLNCTAQLSPVQGEHVVTLRALLNGNEINGPIPIGSMIELVAEVDPVMDNMHVHTFQFVHSDQIISAEGNTATARLNASETFYVKLFDSSTSSPVFLKQAEVSVVAMQVTTDLAVQCIPSATCQEPGSSVMVEVFVTAGTPTQYEWDVSYTPEVPDVVRTDASEISISPPTPGPVLIKLKVTAPMLDPYTAECEVLFSDAC